MTPLVRNIVIGLAIAVVAYFGWSWFNGSDAETAINERLDALEEIARKEGKESPLQALGRARQASGFVAERAYIELLPGMSPVGGRDSLAGALATARSRADTIDLDFTNRQIDIADTGDRALVVVRAKAKGSMFGDSNSYDARFRMEWEEIDGDWLIIRVERLED